MLVWFFDLPQESAEMPAAFSPLDAAPGASYGFHALVSASESKKSLRETLNPLKTLKTAKSGVFRIQQYQRLRKSRDFAGETNSFRFRFVWASLFRVVPFCDRSGGAARGAQKFGKAPMVEKSFFLRLSP